MTKEVSMFEKIWSLGNLTKLAIDTQYISEHLVVEACVRAGQKVLDVATGTGNTAIAAARRRAHVTASDVVPRMMDDVRKRAEAEQLENIEYHVGDSVPTIPFPDGAFDVTLSSLGVSFFPNHQQVIDEVLRVTRPGGTIGIALWSHASLPSDVFRAGQSLSSDATTIDKIQPAYLLSNGDYVREKLKGRASSIRLISGVAECCYESMDDYIETHFKNHPPGILRYAAYTEEQRNTYKKMLGDISLEYNRATDGTLAIGMDYTILIITKA